MTVQGYKSVLWKPYQEIGQPLYLDPKQLVQASLGQQTTHQLSFKHDLVGENGEMVNGIKTKW